MATTNFIEIPNIDSFVAKWSRASVLVTAELEKATQIATLATQALARRNAPVRTGKLSSSILATSKGLAGVVFVPPTLKYAVYVHDGTGLYGKYHSLIYSQHAKVLATKINPGWGSANKGGYFIIGKYSRGQKPNPFMTRASVEARSVVNQTFKVATQNIVNGLKI